ncbi:predicted protein [Histoplasma capsulatum G186AR]|uniref:Uncharacterized protein n=1 Tax=Ajellomyces capsulatus (strain G186AR / H82 / ATCC MYA-2454 / RMSCC 2432) TaxID=447093 RepID=C0P112_AJECG|nr:uncharacterized protein HCBG_09092 [Histoplasma capsulatum G186AR]EEH02648.1 predicted protein [Histoplasma capsulatum G186AR]
MNAFATKHNCGAKSLLPVAQTSRRHPRPATAGATGSPTALHTQGWIAVRTVVCLTMSAVSLTTQPPVSEGPQSEAGGTLHGPNTTRSSGRRPPFTSAETPPVRFKIQPLPLLFSSQRRLLIAVLDLDLQTVLKCS